MFERLNRRREEAAPETCPCFTCLVYGPRLICHNRWRPQAVDAEEEASSGWGV